LKAVGSPLPTRPCAAQSKGTHGIPGLGMTTAHSASAGALTCESSKAQSPHRVTPRQRDHLLRARRRRRKTTKCQSSTKASHIHTNGGKEEGPETWQRHRTASRWARSLGTDSRLCSDIDIKLYTTAKRVKEVILKLWVLKQDWRGRSKDCIQSVESDAVTSLLFRMIIMQWRCSPSLRSIFPCNLPS